ncbi:OmpA family protein [Croceiramulus getboli]|nr:OmpA family protein [Flavobacteriaceae bacterium YJPT1-3]
MKKIVLVFIGIFFIGIVPAQAQFWKKIKERASQVAEETIIRKVEEKTEEKTEQTVDEIFEAPNKIGKQKEDNPASDESWEEEEHGDYEEQEMTVNSNFDFEPGSSIVFSDDFSRDRPGDFPSQWDTNGSGEIVEANGDPWFRLTNKSMYIPLVKRELPENYTIEFDLLTSGLDNRTNSQAFMVLLWADTPGFDRAKTWNMVEISPCQFVPSPGAIEKVENGKRILRNEIGVDYREEIQGQNRISIAVNKTRLRVWLNENKLVDVPRLVPEAANIFKIYTRGLRDSRNVDEIYIKDFRIAETGQDLRSQLMNEGNFTTNEIQFDTNSANLKSSSTSMLDQIGGALADDPSLRVMIVGHTDADGDEASNLLLSQKRAQAVKTYLEEHYGVDPAQLFTSGQGESNPIVSNDTPENKAKNRRVEFIKL